MVRVGLRRKPGKPHFKKSRNLMFPNTKDKLAEARHFLGQMMENRANDIFRYNASAFVSAAEAIIAFLLIESNAGPEFNSWRAKQIDKINKDPFKNIIKEQRDQTNHKRPIKVDTDVTVFVAPLTLQIEVIPVTVSVSAADNIVYSPISVNSTLPVASTTPPKVGAGNTTRSKSTHYFRGHREKDAVSICKNHLENLMKLVEVCETELNKFSVDEVDKRYATKDERQNPCP